MARPGEYPCRLVPVLGQAGCAGHLFRGARGFRAFDRDGKQIGTFEKINVGAAALLELAITTEETND